MRLFRRKPARVILTVAEIDSTGVTFKFSNWSGTARLGAVGEQLVVRPESIELHPYGGAERRTL